MTDFRRSIHKKLYKNRGCLKKRKTEIPYDKRYPGKQQHLLWEKVPQTVFFDKNN